MKGEEFSFTKSTVKSLPLPISSVYIHTRSSKLALELHVISRVGHDESSTVSLAIFLPNSSSSSIASRSISRICAFAASRAASLEEGQLVP